MKASTGMTPLESIHFHDVEKNADIQKDLQRYQEHLGRIFISEKLREEALVTCACWPDVLSLSY